MEHMDKIAILLGEGLSAALAAQHLLKCHNLRDSVRLYIYFIIVVAIAIVVIVIIISSSIISITICYLCNYSCIT